MYLMFNQTGDFNTKILEQKLQLKQLQMKTNLKKFFDEFSDSNKLVFAKMKDTVRNEENTLRNSLSDLTNQINIYFTEESIK